MKRIGIILLIIGCLVGAGYGAYQWYLTTPLYSLVQIRSSIRDHNWDRFTTYVDVDKMARGVAHDMNAIIRESVKDKASSLITQGLGLLVSIKIRSGLKTDLKAWVEGQPLSSNSILGSFIQPGESSIPRIKHLSWKKNEGTAELGFKNGASLVLGMEKNGITWQVGRIMNVRELYEESRRKKQAQ